MQRRYNFRERSDQAKFANHEPSRTDQTFKSACDINNILKKYVRNGNTASLAVTANAKFGDFTNVPSYEEAYDFVCKAGEAFNALPAIVRKRFDNDPGQLLAFLSDANNRDEAVKLGLMEKPVQEMNSSLENKNPPEAAKKPEGQGT